jgi:hypothetical protein
VGQVVDSGQQLAAGEVSDRAEDDQRGRADRQALKPLDQRVLERLWVYVYSGQR